MTTKEIDDRAWSLARQARELALSIENLQKDAEIVGVGFVLGELLIHLNQVCLAIKKVKVEE